MPINWKVTKEEMKLIQNISRRAVEIWPKAKTINIDMDITATHCNGCPLDLEKLLAADDFNFAHDIAGISNCLDRKTGKLTNCFLPRYAKPERRA